jgi:hypothetical protein
LIIKINRNNYDYDKSKKKGEVKETGKSDKQMDTIRREKNQKILDRRKGHNKEN